MFLVSVILIRGLVTTKLQESNCEAWRISATVAVGLEPTVSSQRQRRNAKPPEPVLFDCSACTSAYRPLRSFGSPLAKYFRRLGDSRLQNTAPISFVSPVRRRLTASFANSPRRNVCLTRFGCGLRLCRAAMPSAFGFRSYSGLITQDCRKLTCGTVDISKYLRRRYRRVNLDSKTCKLSPEGLEDHLPLGISS